VSIIGNYSEYDRREPFVPPTPLTFGEGEEVKIYITALAEGTAAILGPKYAEIGIVEKVRVGE